MAGATAARTVTRDASEQRFGDFKPVVGTTGATLHVLTVSLTVSSNHAESMRYLQEAGLRPLTYREVLSLLMEDEGLKNSLKGKWFYLDGIGIDESGIYTVDDKGNLVKEGMFKKKNVSIEEKVRVWGGSNPLSLYVYSDINARDGGRRFGLGGSCGPRDVAPVVVGVPKERAPKNAPVSDSEIKEMIRSTLPSIIAALEPSANAQILENLRKLQRAASE